MHSDLSNKRTNVFRYAGCNFDFAKKRVMHITQHNIFGFCCLLCGHVALYAFSALFGIVLNFLVSHGDNLSCS